MKEFLYFKIKNIKLYNPHITTMKLAHISDIHFSRLISDQKLEAILHELKQNQPDYIMVTGDNVDHNNVLENQDHKNRFLEFHKQLANLAPTFEIFGSHDFSYHQSQNPHWFYQWNEEWLGELDKFENLYIMRDQIITGEEFRIIGFNHPWNYYHVKDTRIEDKYALIQDLNNNFPNTEKNPYFPVIKDDKCNILLAHSPIFILDPEVQQNTHILKHMDMIMTGHMHNGMIPPILDELITNSKGLFAPNKSLFPNNTRGIIPYKQPTGKITNLCISGGITKLQETAPTILHPFKNIYPMSLDFYHLSKLHQKAPQQKAYYKKAQ